MLRVGIVLDSYNTSAWIAETVTDMQRGDFARVELVVIASASRTAGQSGPAKLSLLWKRRLFEIYEQWDYRRNGTTPDALEQIDLGPMLQEVPAIQADPNFDAEGMSVAQDVAGKIAGYNLDLLLHFGSYRPIGALLKTARCGVWSFDPDSPKSGKAPFFHELYTSHPVCESSLRVIGETATEDIVIYASSASTDMQSLFRSRNSVYWKNVAIAGRRLRDLHTRGFASILAESASASATQGRNTPNAAQMSVFMARYALNWIANRVASLRGGPRAKWCIAIRRRSEAHRYDDPAGFELMRSNKDSFHADPFLFEKDGKTFLFFEDFRFSLGRAIICCCELAADGRPGPIVEVLRRPYHLSYPFVFQDGDDIFMLPETRGNRSVELYRATNFPHEWTLDTVLLNDVDIVDSTIEKIDGRYWMFCGISNGRFSNCDELGLFFAESLRGPWTMHPKTPLISDVQRARPAGKLFYDNGRLIRPSQDCGAAYGYALVFSEIVTVTETDYEERFISRLKPEVIPHNLANHTYNRTEKFEVVDRNFPAKVATESD